MVLSGNVVVNSMTEANLGGVAKPTNETPRAQKEEYIRAKYEARQFVDVTHLLCNANPDDTPEDVLGMALMKAAISGDLPGCLQLIVHSGSDIVNWRDPSQGYLSALHCAAAAGHKAIMGAQLPTCIIDMFCFMPSR